jgi:hypothetical protein
MAGLTAFYFVVVLIGGFFFQRNVTCKNCAQSRLGCPANRGMRGNKRK